MTRYAYDTQGRLVRRTLAEGQAFAFTYDAFGNKRSETVAETDGTVVEEQLWEYDAFGRVQRYTDWADGYINASDNGEDRAVTSYGYDAYGRLITQTSTDETQTVASVEAHDDTFSARLFYTHGQSLSYDYLSNGWLAGVTDHDGGLSTRYGYNAAGRRVLERTQSRIGDEALRHTVASYDNAGRLSRARDLLSATQQQRGQVLFRAYSNSGVRSQQQRGQVLFRA